MNMIELLQNEKDSSIDEILSKGLVKPKSLWEHLCEIRRALGFRYIFMNTAHSIMMTLAISFGFALLYPLFPAYATLFTVSPLSFIFIVLITETLEKCNGLYEIKMVCKYTLQQISAFRVLCFSLMGVAVCIFFSVYFSRLPVAYDFFRAFSLSLCALFLCSFLTIGMMRLLRWKWIRFFIMPLWILFCMLPAWIFRSQWEAFLSQIPVALTLFSALVACALFLMEIKKLMNVRKSEVAYDAGC